MKNGKAILGVIALVLVGGSTFAQKKGKYGATDEDSTKCVENLSLYIEFYKQKNYADALSGWRWVYNNCPRSSKKMYANGAKMYKYLSKKEKDAAKKEKLVDTLMATYDQRIENFGQEGFVLGMKGEAYMQYRKGRVEEAYDILKKSVDLTGKKSKAGPLTAYFQASVKMMEIEKLTKEAVIEAFGLVAEIIDYQLGKLTDEKKKQFYVIAKDNVELLFGQVATCEDLIPYYKGGFEANKENVNWLKKGVGMLDKKDCTDDPLFYSMAVTLQKLEPSMESARSLGRLASKNKQYQDAIGFFKQAISLNSDKINIASDYFSLAGAYAGAKQYSMARDYALKASTANPSWGEPHLLIGTIYARSAKDCGEDEFKISAVYWVAVDRFIKAKSVDANVADEANMKIATWSKYFPAKKEAFMYNAIEGGSYTVECWINETTTIRVQ